MLFSLAACSADDWDADYRSENRPFKLPFSLSRNLSDTSRIVHPFVRNRSAASAATDTVSFEAKVTALVRSCRLRWVGAAMAAMSSVAALHLPTLPPTAARAAKAGAAHSSSHRHFANPFGDAAAAGGDTVFPAAAIAAAGGDLLGSIVAASWRPDAGLLDCGEGLHGTDLYTGYGGVAAALLRRGMLLRDSDALKQAAAMLDACIKAEEGRAASHKARGRAPQIDVTMIMGLPGLWALRAVTAHALGDTATRNKRIAEIVALAKAGYVNGPGAVARSLPSEMLYGRAGFLYACLFVNTHCSDSSSSAAGGAAGGGAGSAGASASGSGELLIPDAVTAPIVAEIIDIGRHGSRERAAAAGSKAAVPPLFYTWHGSPYLGAAHGLAGICHMLLHYPLNPAAHAEVVGSLRHLLSVRYPSGNMPSSDDGRHTDASTDKLVHWCHGATGLALTMARAWELTRDPDFATAAVEAAEVVWQRGLLTKLGLCHGVAGNAYAFLAVRRIALQIAREAAGASGASAAAASSAGSSSAGAAADRSAQAAGWSELAELSLRRARCFASFLVFGPPARHAGGAASGSAAASGPSAAAPKEHYWERLVAAGEMHGGDRALSLFEGAAGAAWALMDIGAADDARALPPSFPGYEL